MQGKVYRYHGAATDPLALWQSLNLQGSAKWFGWSETQMYLPYDLPTALPQEPWERLTIFNEHAELRLLHTGDETVILLLTEQELPPQGSEWSQCGDSYETESACHILLGDPPESAGGATTQLADVAFPRMFDYGIALMPSKGRRHKVILKVYYYYDSAHRLRYIRYAGLDQHTW